MYRDPRRGLVVGLTAMIVPASATGVAVAQPGSTPVCVIPGSGPHSATPFPRFANDPSTGFATSDHDPLIASLDLAASGDRHRTTG